MKDIAISVKNLHKDFRLPREKSNSLKHIVINLARGRRGYDIQKVLRGIDFEIEKGDFFGIVGRNGSGKSTLLKVLAHIYEPEKGNVRINGSLVPFIELGVGFNPELTGRENIYLNGALLGFSNVEVGKMYKEIVDFAELERFMDQKLKNYSSGMQVRLAFSIAIRANPDILLLDEILAVGDEAFQRKCYSYFAKLKKEKKTVILVTHSMDQVQQFCNKALLLQDGKITSFGNPAVVAQKYRELNQPAMLNGSGDGAKVNNYVNLSAKCKMLDSKIRIDLDFTQNSPIEDPVIAVGINRDNGEQVYRWVSDERIDQKIDLRKTNHLELEVSNIFPSGEFNINVFVKKRDRSFDYASFYNIAKFESGNRSDRGWDLYWKPDESYKLTKAKV